MARDQFRNSPEYILLPVNPLFIGFTLLLAVLLNVIPLGRVVGMPDWVALSLVFWNIHQPRRVGMLVAFLLGLCVDVGDAALLGEHALAYTILSFAAISLHRRALWFGVLGQMLHVLPLLLMVQAVILLIRMGAGGVFPGVGYFLESVIATLLWPVIAFFYLAPQRRAVDRDEHRPL